MIMIMIVMIVLCYLLAHDYGEILLVLVLVFLSIITIVRFTILTTYNYKLYVLLLIYIALDGGGCLYFNTNKSIIRMTTNIQIVIPPIFLKT